MSEHERREREAWTRYVGAPTPEARIAAFRAWQQARDDLEAALHAEAMAAAWQQ